MASPNLMLVLHNSPEDSMLTCAKPLEIYRAHGDSLLCTIDWHSGAEKTTIGGFPGRYDEEFVYPGFMDENLRFSMQDGASFEWDGVWGYDFVW